MYETVNPHQWPRAALRAASTTFTDNADTSNGHHEKNEESQYDGQHA